LRRTLIAAGKVHKEIFFPGEIFFPWDTKTAMVEIPVGGSAVTKTAMEKNTQLLYLNPLWKYPPQTPNPPLYILYIGGGDWGFLRGNYPHD